MFRWRSWPRRSRTLHGKRPFRPIGRVILDQAMSRLKPEDRLVITLFELEDRSVREVAELTGWSETRVKVRAFRARQALKRHIGGEDER